ncbi:unnamed protein product [Arctia plantaginis]|uniref:Uncharacterized protein n=1 Tax=Arctia plantaginis TaxID=874455 RepID=A0A8S1B236_ARCPL|nr:unnamed protein product [Arctia plantaginis]CAB3256496.1 unnamed protein product [Arctia plantaginis]
MSSSIIRILTVPVGVHNGFLKSNIASYATRKKNKKLYIQGIFNHSPMCWKLKYYNTILLNQIYLSIFFEELFGKTQLLFFNNLRAFHLVLAVGMLHEKCERSNLDLEDEALRWFLNNI